MDEISEAQRLQRLHDLGILDTGEDKLFRGFAEQALAVMPGTTIAAISLIDTDRQWFKTIVGLGVKETARNLSFCSHTIQETSGVMVVEDATCDPRFARNSLVTSQPGIRFYAGVRLTGGVGAICAIGRQPRQATENEVMKLTKLAQYVDIQLLAHGTLFNLAISARA
ncbi:MAG: GAF domain-containing protein [Beijerinckiaceae bacterium]|nr:GAF domain-containing protein [Beijerinckiaceae bacterium]